MVDTLQAYSLVLKHFARLQLAQKIELADKSLAERLSCLVKTCYEQIQYPNESSTAEFLTRLKPHFTSLVESKSSDLGIWTAVAGLLMDFNSPAVPETSPTSTLDLTLREYDDTNHAVLLKLHHKWTREYLPESLDALRDEIRRNGQRIAGGLQIYARTLLLVQSTGMGKSRLADKFGETCPMINFTLGEANFKCYPPVDGEVRSFLCKELPKKTKDMILDSPRRNRISPKLKSPTLQTPTPKMPKLDRRVQPRADKSSQSSEEIIEQFMENLAIMAWNHTRAAAFLQACFEACKLYQLFII